MRAMSAPTELLSEPLPREPLTLAAAWLAEAFGARCTPNPNAMTLATSTPAGAPSARVVLCKDIVADPGYVVFYTNYRSRKGRELEENARAAAVLHFDAQHRQIRIEGIVEQAPRADSDAYFASRALESRVGAWASAQSEPLSSRAQLLAAVEQAAARFGTNVPRPPHWGGYRLWAEAVELWVEGAARIHDRARWSRVLTRRADGRLETGAWSATRLSP
jgi:pyridoxamine 5'-phosphate oxidase